MGAGESKPNDGHKKKRRRRRKPKDGEANSDNVDGTPPSSFKGSSSSDDTPPPPSSSIEETDTANLGLTDKEEQLIRAILRKSVKDVKKLLKSPQVNPKLRVEGDNSTLLHFAAVMDTPDLCRLLYDAGAPLNAQDSFGNTPLHLAASRGFYEVLSILLDLDAVAAVKNIDGMTACDIAEEKHYNDCVVLLRPYTPITESSHSEDKSGYSSAYGGGYGGYGSGSGGSGDSASDGGGESLDLGSEGEEAGFDDRSDDITDSSGETLDLGDGSGDGSGGGSPASDALSVTSESTDGGAAGGGATKKASGSKGKAAAGGPGKKSAATKKGMKRAKSVDFDLGDDDDGLEDTATSAADGSDLLSGGGGGATSGALSPGSHDGLSYEYDTEGGVFPTADSASGDASGDAPAYEYEYYDPEPVEPELPERYFKRVRREKETKDDVFHAPRRPCIAHLGVEGGAEPCGNLAYKTCGHICKPCLRADLVDFCPMCNTITEQTLAVMSHSGSSYDASSASSDGTSDAGAAGASASAKPGAPQTVGGSAVGAAKPGEAVKATGGETAPAAEDHSADVSADDASEDVSASVSEDES